VTDKREFVRLVRSAGAAVRRVRLVRQPFGQGPQQRPSIGQLLVFFGDARPLEPLQPEVVVVVGLFLDVKDAPDADHVVDVGIERVVERLETGSEQGDGDEAGTVQGVAGHGGVALLEDVQREYGPGQKHYIR
jgi:hypothetical protein